MGISVHTEDFKKIKIQPVKGGIQLIVMNGRLHTEMQIGESVDPNDPFSWPRLLDAASNWFATPAVSSAGAVASIVGAAIAIRQAVKAKGYANQAEQVLDTTKRQKRLLEVARIYQATRTVVDRVAQIGPSSSAAKLKGLDPSDIAGSVQSFLAELSELRDHFSEDEENPAEDLVAALRPLVSRLSSSTTPQQIKSVGEELHRLLTDFLPIAKSHSDHAQTQIPEQLARR